MSRAILPSSLYLLAARYGGGAGTAIHAFRHGLDYSIISMRWPAFSAYAKASADLVLHALGLGAYESLAGLLLSDSPDGVSISQDLAFTV